jgi:four helix bundle protein
MKENIIKEKSFKFALRIIKLCNKLREKHEFVISKQLVKSWTSIWANIEEAIAGQSKRDFLMKMTIANKEARETRYRLLLIKEWNLLESNIWEYLEEIEDILNIITKITKTTKENLKNNS